MDFGLIVDVETTGLEPDKDKIIEIGLLEFSVDGHETPLITGGYGALEDPGFEISPEVTKVTGLKRAHLLGHKIDWLVVRRYMEKASIIIAHNADFDRAFINRRPELYGVGTHWGCSMRHIDWHKHNFGTRSLNYLAADHGFINPFAHRAIFDCATTFRLIVPYLKELIERSYEKEFIVKAVRSPFETKDLLKSRGYRWDAGERCWSRVIGASALPEERTFLETSIYNGLSCHQEIEINGGELSAAYE